MKKVCLLCGVKYLIVGVLLLATVFANATVACAEDNKKEDEWRFTLVPYIWLPSVSGSFKFTVPPAGTGLVRSPQQLFLAALTYLRMII